MSCQTVDDKARRPTRRIESDFEVPLRLPADPPVVDFNRNGIHQTQQRPLVREQRCRPRPSLDLFALSFQHVRRSNPFAVNVGPCDHREAFWQTVLCSRRQLWRIRLTLQAEPIKFLSTAAQRESVCRCRMPKFIGESFKFFGPRSTAGCLPDCQRH